MNKQTRRSFLTVGSAAGLAAPLPWFQANNGIILRQGKMLAQERLRLGRTKLRRRT